MVRRVCGVCCGVCGGLCDGGLVGLCGRVWWQWGVWWGVCGVGVSVVEVCGGVCGGCVVGVCGGWLCVGGSVVGFGDSGCVVGV